ncbi:homeobox KN domain-containing protein [Amylocarpus encephaloides]|uniref:Homeobox KN domain-containing protein n=1 Tax=Amylocarpus encephaloides TaxID=45428 RepID=A0A9P7YG02_9HELO|nr:homeobox KN domain-containing protein [Amylocarpus encephaloides]
MEADGTLVGDHYRRDPSSEKFELPPIRIAVPEFDQVRSPVPSSHSPTNTVDFEYYSSQLSYNRGGPSGEEADTEMERWSYNIPRSFPGKFGKWYWPQSDTIPARTGGHPRQSPSHFKNPWAGPRGRSPSTTCEGHSPLISPANFERPTARPSWGLSMNMSGGRPDYPLDPSQQGLNGCPQSSTYISDPSPAYHQQPAMYGSHQSSAHSFLGAHNPLLSHFRPPFPNTHHNGYSRNSYQSHVSKPGVNKKPRNRGGNLPKEATDKLKTWFVSHLQHPYPTETEKKTMVKEIGLKMIQISNWFINARRRQLPAMINNARAEAAARNARESNSDHGNDRRKSSEGDGEFGTSRRVHC